MEFGFNRFGLRAFRKSVSIMCGTRMKRLQMQFTNDISTLSVWVYRPTCKSWQLRIRRQNHTETLHGGWDVFGLYTSNFRRSDESLSLELFCCRMEWCWRRNTWPSRLRSTSSVRTRSTFTGGRRYERRTSCRNTPRDTCPSASVNTATLFRTEVLYKVINSELERCNPSCNDHAQPAADKAPTSVTAVLPTYSWTHLWK